MASSLNRYGLMSPESVPLPLFPFAKARQTSHGDAVHVPLRRSEKCPAGAGSQMGDTEVQLGANPSRRSRVAFLCRRVAPPAARAVRRLSPRLTVWVPLHQLYESSDATTLQSVAALHIAAQFSFRLVRLRGRESGRVFTAGHRTDGSLPLLRA